MSDPFDPAAGEPKKLPRSLCIERALLALGMALLCIITMANVVVRYFTNISFAFTEEISVWLMVFITLVGASSAFFTDRHISVTVVVERFPPRARRIVSLIAPAATLLMFVLLAWYGGRMAYDDFRYEVTSPALGVPQWIYSVWLPALSLAIAARLVQLIVHRLRAAQ
jgi:TRAP-type C4-dicarboxylate transport system permease small subunit